MARERAMLHLEYSMRLDCETDAERLGDGDGDGGSIDLGPTTVSRGLSESLGLINLR